MTEIAEEPPGQTLAPSRLRTTFSALGVRNFRLFFIGQGISLVGTWVRRTAMGWLVYQLTGSTAQLGLVMGLALLPLFVLSPWAGSIADRVDKRWMIIYTQVLATATSAAIAVLIFAHVIQVWHLMILATLSGVAFAFEVPSRQSFIVEMVGRDKLMNAIALNSGLVNLSRVLGPATAGLLMGGMGMGSCFVLDALSYVVVIVTLILLRLPKFEKKTHAQSHWEALIEGAREVRKNPTVRVMLILLSAVGIFGWSFETLMPAIARDDLKLNALAYGILLSLLGTGATLGAIYVASRDEKADRRSIVFGGLWLTVAGMMLVSILGAVLGSSRSAFWGVGAGLLLAGVGAIAFLSTANTLVQTNVEDRMRGRIMGIWAVSFGGAVPIGSFLSGFAARVFSPFVTIAGFATVLLAVSVVTFYRLPVGQMKVGDRNRGFLIAIALFASLTSFEIVAVADPIAETAIPTVMVSTAAEPVTAGKFQPTWESLKQYRAPEWFRDAKFGIWACFGPQNQPEQGDWYARNMYAEGSRQNKFHVETYGPPSEFGFKDVIHVWKAEKWDPEKLVALYKRAGAQYFFAMANHHDNFDLYESQYQPWNSVEVGPKKDIVGGFAQAARRQNLRFGVSVHAAHAWSFYELAQAADKNGPLAGIAYDGGLTKAEGKGKWWDGLDPQDLYAQNHAPSAGFATPTTIHTQWDYKNGASIPDAAYCEKFYNRTMDLLHKYQPDLLYFDDDALPLWPVSDAGLKIAADFYNSNMKRHGGRLEAVLLGKQLNAEERKCLVWDIERGASNHIEPFPWQTDTCIGNWHYERSLYERNAYKSAATVIHMLADVVSKNGNLLLNIPVRGDGTIDDKEQGVLEGIASWMDVNRECIFGTRPWKLFGEGPASGGAALIAQGFNEGKGTPFSAADVRFTTRAGVLYVIVLGAPVGPTEIKALGTAAKLLERPVGHVTLLGTKEKVTWEQRPDALIIQPAIQWPTKSAVVFAIDL